jgi:16S rRNA (guanine527-N7)-methyltransferase
VKHQLAPVSLERFVRLCDPVVEDSGERRTCAERLLAHYETLRAWSRIHDLIGPGTVDEALGRHYGEALAAVGWLPREGLLVDLGSGAGFPGFVLACARPGLRVVLVEPRMKRAAFLRAAARAAGLALEVHAARLPLPLPAVFDQGIAAVTVRALKVDAPTAAALVARLEPTGRWLVWSGRRVELPEGVVPVGRVDLPGQRDAHIVVAGRSDVKD